MTAPLFTVKSRFSDFVKHAQEEDPVIVTKHGKPAVAIISIDDYEEKFQGRKDRAQILYERWRANCISDLDGPDPFENVRDKWAPPLDAPGVFDED